MPVYRVNSVGSVGLVSQSDQRPYEIPPEGWSRVENARMLNDSAVSVQPWEAITDTGSLTAHALDFYTPPAGGNQWLYVYTDDKIISIDNNGTPNDVNKAGLVFDPYPDNVWVTDQLSGIPLATNNRDQPQCFYNAGGGITNTTLSQNFPDWDAGGTYENATCKVIAAYKNFIVAANIVDVNAYPNMVIWSDAAEPGLMPASWDYNDTTNLAGRTVLGADDGAILAMKPQRDSLIIYCEYATYRMDFIGGAFVMRFTKIFDNSGVFGPRAVGSFGERHFVITKSDAIIHDGQQLTSVADERTRNRILQGVSEADVNRIWVNPLLRYSEMWLSVPLETAGVKTNNTAIVWQWDDNAWSVRDLPDSRYMKELPILTPSQTDSTWNGGPNTTWNGGPDNIWDQTSSVGDLDPVVTSTDGFLYQTDVGEQIEDTLLEREDLNLSGDQNSEMAVYVYPRVRGNTPIIVQMGASNSVETGVVWDREITFDPTTDYKVMARATGRRHAIRFRGKSFQLEGYDIEWRPAGRR